MVQKISNELLISAYKRARTLKLDSYFIYLLETEMQRRNII